MISIFRNSTDQEASQEDRHHLCASFELENKNSSPLSQKGPHTCYAQLKNE